MPKKEFFLNLQNPKIFQSGI